MFGRVSALLLVLLPVGAADARAFKHPPGWRPEAAFKPDPCAARGVSDRVRADFDLGSATACTYGSGTFATYWIQYRTKHGDAGREQFADVWSEGESFDFTRTRR
jgi:hypothetical protein